MVGSPLNGPQGIMGGGGQSVVFLSTPPKPPMVGHSYFSIGFLKRLANHRPFPLSFAVLEWACECERQVKERAWLAINPMKSCG